MSCQASLTNMLYYITHFHIMQQILAEKQQMKD